MAIIDTILSTVGTVIDRVVPDKNKRAEAKEELEKLLAWYEDKERYIKGYTDLVEQYRRDERVRIENPIVQKAYDKYKTLLELTRN